MRRLLRTLGAVVFLLVVAFLLARFFNENSDPIHLQFWLWRTHEVSKGLLFVLAFFLGVAVVSFASVSAVLSKVMETSRLRRENMSLQRLLESKKREETSK